MPFSEHISRVVLFLKLFETRKIVTEQISGVGVKLYSAVNQLNDPRPNGLERVMTDQYNWDRYPHPDLSF